MFDDTTLTVYQAFSPAIAEAAVVAGTLVPPFKLDRMTWIKPSFLWMMYRCGWATKPGQERVLAIRIRRDGFERALAQSCLSHYDPAVYASHDEWLRRKQASPVRVQWDPERSARAEPLSWRSIQIGLSGVAVQHYVSEWIREISDITHHVSELRESIRCGRSSAMTGLPEEQPYPLPSDIAKAIGAAA